MRTYELIAYILAALFFLLAALGAKMPPTWWGWLPLGLLAWVSVPLILTVRAN